LSNVDVHVCVEREDALVNGARPGHERRVVLRCRRRHPHGHAQDSRE
jgi:hypothetical protein